MENSIIFKRSYLAQFLLFEAGLSGFFGFEGLHIFWNRSQRWGSFAHRVSIRAHLSLLRHTRIACRLVGDTATAVVSSTIYGHDGCLLLDFSRTNHVPCVPCPLEFCGECFVFLRLLCVCVFV